MAGLAVVSTRQVGVRPRVLTINRHNPGDVALRVLRRFSYTEGDSFAQYDKLLSAYDVADWSEPFVKKILNNTAYYGEAYASKRKVVKVRHGNQMVRKGQARPRDEWVRYPDDVVLALALQPTELAMAA